ncbi:MAG: rod shape-determining protein [Clostridia bacterium]|nr:rod shape-determining protein [Clostridia bacterium]
MATTLLALKLGSTTTTIYKDGEGLVLKEPSMIAVTGSIRSREIRAVGSEAKRLLGRTSDGLQVISPISGGTVTDSELASLMLKRFLKQIEIRQGIFKDNVRALLCVPLGINLVERKTLEKVCYDAGISDVIMIPAIICSAVGDNIDISSSEGKLLVNIGGGATNIAVCANNQIITGLSASVGGANISVAIEKLVEEKHNLRVGPGAAEALKENICSLYPDSSLSGEITGVNKETKESTTVTVTSNDVYVIVDHYYSRIVDAIASCVANCPPDIVKDVSLTGIHVFGGGAFVPGLERYLKAKTGLPVHISENAKTDIFGAAKLIDDPSALRDILLNV